MVHEIDNLTCVSPANNAPTKLVFPAPEGAVTMNKLPEVFMGEILSQMARLFDVLYLFPDLLDQYLELHRGLRCFG